MTAAFNMSTTVEGNVQMEQGCEDLTVTMDTTELETDLQPENDELPPDYESLASPVSVIDGRDVYLTHLDFVPDSRRKQQQQSPTLIAEAPPSYKQLYGNVEDSVDRGRTHNGRRIRYTHSRRPHTRPRRSSGVESESSGETDLLSQLSKKFSSIKTATLGLMGFIATLYLLSFSMVIVGALNINICQSIVVPVYLIVAGLIQTFSLLFQTITCIGEKRGIEKCSAIRIFDCFGLLLFIWLIIGSNWMIRAGWSRNNGLCSDVIYYGKDYVFLAVNSTDSSYEVPEIDNEPTDHDVPLCLDCSKSVYLFTSVVIVLQYIMIIMVCMSCCSVLYRSNNSHHSRSSRSRSRI